MKKISVWDYLEANDPVKGLHTYMKFTRERKPVPETIVLTPSQFKKLKNKNDPKTT